MPDTSYTLTCTLKCFYLYVCSITYKAPLSMPLAASVSCHQIKETKVFCLSQDLFIPSPLHEHLRSTFI